jgi:hypothetical protein
LNTVVEGLRLSPKDPDFTSILNLLLRDAESAATRSKQEAIKLNAQVEAEEAFGQGLQREREATRLQPTGRIDAVTRAFWAAADQFRAAAELSRQIAAENAAEQAAVKTKPNDGSNAPAQRPTPAPQAERKLPDSALEEAAVKNVLRQYEAAYASLRADAVRSVYPTAPVGQLASEFASYRTYTLTIKALEFKFYYTATQALAAVPAEVFHDVVPQSGPGKQFHLSQTIQLEKRGSTWVILQIR